MIAVDSNKNDSHSVRSFRACVSGWINRISSKPINISTIYQKDRTCDAGKTVIQHYQFQLEEQIDGTNIHGR